VFVCFGFGRPDGRVGVKPEAGENRLVLIRLDTLPLSHTHTHRHAHTHTHMHTHSHSHSHTHTHTYIDTHTHTLTRTHTHTDTHTRIHTDAHTHTHRHTHTLHYYTNNFHFLVNRALSVLSGRVCLCGNALISLSYVNYEPISAVMDLFLGFGL